MCGITGIISFGGDSKAKQSRMKIVEDMTHAITHRGPDDHALWGDDHSPVAFGHRRLSIIDLSPEGRQPMESASARYVIAYNGEIYNFLELRKDLEQKDISFRGRSDTEVLLAGFDHWGVNLTLQKINGMFAIALWDRQERRLYLIRDRLGKKPLYVGWAGDNLLFSSELKSFHTCGDFKPSIDRNVCALYMRYSYVPAPFCIFENCITVPPGAVVRVNTQQTKTGDDLSSMIEPYWSHKQCIEDAVSKRQNISDEDALNGFERELKAAVSRRMISDVPLGAFLSGGLDSTLVVALMQQISDSPVKTFSVGFSESEFDEARHARRVAEFLGTEHHETYLQPEDALDLIPNLPDMYDEPFADQSQLPTAIISAYARKHVTVVLSGDGGDEVLGGYQRHYSVPSLWSKIKYIPRPLRAGMACLLESMPYGFWGVFNKVSPQIAERAEKVTGILGQKSAEDVYRHLLSHWKRTDDLVLGGQEPQMPLYSERMNIKSLSFAERMMYGDALSYLPNDILVKVDRASMAYALEARAPFLDVNLFSYLWSLPHSMKVRGGKGKWLSRKLLERYLPSDIFDRPKQGFSVPVRKWLQGPLNSWANDLISHDRLRADGILNPDLVRKEWDCCVDEKANARAGAASSRMWNVLMFQAWKQKWMP